MSLDKKWFMNVFNYLTVLIIILGFALFLWKEINWQLGKVDPDDDDDDYKKYGTHTERSIGHAFQTIRDIILMFTGILIVYGVVSTYIS